VNKKRIMKGILLLIVLALLTIGFTGCGGVISPTGTVHIIVSGTYYYDYYDVFIDSIQEFSAVEVPGTGVLDGIPIGTHFFEVININGLAWGYDSVTQYIHSGVNYVYLNP